MMNMNKFSNNLVRVLDEAVDVAINLRHNTIELDHMLYAITNIDYHVYALLNKHGITNIKLRSMIDSIRTPEKGDALEPDMSIDVKLMLETASAIAEELGEDTVNVFHVVLALLQCEDNTVLAQILKNMKIKKEEIVMEILDSISMNEAKECTELVEAWKPIDKVPTTLDKFCKDITKMAYEGRLDPCIGRDYETERVIQVLSRRTKNNPVLVGPAGVGKTTVVEGLAQRIVNGDVPLTLKGCSIFSLDMGCLLAGAKYRGDFEDRLKKIVEEVTNRNDLIIFMDEIHTMVGAGAGGDGNIDAGNMLKPALARGEIKVVGSTTFDEYSRYIEKDAALERRFQQITVDEPTKEQTIQILNGIKAKYEEFHKVVLSDAAIEACVNLSTKYISNRQLPDKAIDLMDETCSRVRLAGAVENKELTRVKEKIENLRARKEQAIADAKYKEVVEINKEMTEQEELKALLLAEEKEINEKPVEVSVEAIAEVVEMWTGVPTSKMLESESQKLLNLEKTMHEKVIGQHEAIEAIGKAIRRSRAGLGDPSKPIASFFFAGPSGVGKTYIAKTLSDIQFAGEDSIIRIDCSELMESHSVSKLIGSPAGYVGYDDNGGLLCDAVRRKPYSLVLFDEVEKAHPKVLDILLQILDDGRITDNHGRIVNFKNTIIILTSNIGCKTLANKSKAMGFGTKDEKAKVKNEYADLKKSVNEEMKKHFRPEFINRLDEVIVFHNLTRENIMEIVKLQTRDLVAKMKDRGIELNLTKKVVEFVGDKGTNLEFGARPLARAIQQFLENPLAEEVIAGRIKEGDKVTARVVGDKVVFRKARVAVELEA